MSTEGMRLRVTTDEEARAQLPDGLFFRRGAFRPRATGENWLIWDDDITLSGQFTDLDLEAIAYWMRTHGAKNNE